MNSEYPPVWAFGGGKGGVGKSLVCASVAIEAARRGLRVVALDVDLGAANLHTLLGMLNPPRTLDDFLSGDEFLLDDVAVETSTPNLRLVSGAAAILQAAHPKPADRRRLVKAFLALDADVLLIDLGAGTHHTTLDFFNLAGVGMIVTGPEPTSIQNSYGFLKAALFRRIEEAFVGHPWVRDYLVRAAQPRGVGRLESVGKLLDAIEAHDSVVGVAARTLVADFQPRLVINQAGTREQKRVQSALTVVCERYLAFDLHHIATLPADPEARRAIRRMKPVLSEGDTALGRSIAGLVDCLVALPAAPHPESLLREPTPEVVEPAPRVESSPEPVASPASSPSPVAELQPVAEPEPVAEVEAEPVAEPEPVAEAEPVAEPEPVAEAEPVAEPEPVKEVEPERVAEPELAKAPEPGPLEAAESEAAESEVSDREPVFKLPPPLGTPPPVASRPLELGGAFDTPSTPRPVPVLDPWSANDIPPLLSPIDEPSSGVEAGPSLPELPESEPEPELPALALPEPLEHEAISVEASVTVDGDTLHLQVADLAPLSAAVRTALYRAGHRIGHHDQSYHELLGADATGRFDDVAGAIEALHAKTTTTLSEGGLSELSWLN